MKQCYSSVVDRSVQTFAYSSYSYNTVSSPNSWSRRKIHLNFKIYAPKSHNRTRQRLGEVFSIPIICLLRSNLGVTAFSPFELVYDCCVQGPLDVLEELLIQSKKSNTNVVFQVLTIRDRLDDIKEIVEDNLQAAQQLQKSWYDKRACERHFQKGDDVLVPLPTLSSKLEAQWQGPYKSLNKVRDVKYVVNMHNKCEGERTFQVNLLKKWHSSPDASCQAQEFDTDVSDDIVRWNSEEPTEPSHLTSNNYSICLLKTQMYLKIHTSLSEHSITTRDASPVHLPLYRVPQLIEKQLVEKLMTCLRLE